MVKTELFEDGYLSYDTALYKLNKFINSHSSIKIIQVITEQYSMNSVQEFKHRYLLIYEEN